MFVPLFFLSFFPSFFPSFFLSSFTASIIAFPPLHPSLSPYLFPLPHSLSSLFLPPSKTQLNLHLKQHHGVQSSKSKTKVRFHLHPSLPSPYLLRSLPPLCPPSKTQLNLHLKQHHGVQSTKKRVRFLQPLPTLLKSCPTLPSL